MLQVTQIIKQAEQGITTPFLCRASDDKLYWVKGRTVGKAGLCFEWISGNIGVEFGLPIPAFKQIEVCNELIAESEIQNINELGAGVWFASTDAGHVCDLKYSDISKITTELRSKILVFDWWIKNADRTLGPSGGNVNLLWHSYKEKVSVFDHNLAFDNEFNIEEFKNNHVFRNDFQNAKNKFVKEDYNKMYGIINNLDNYYNELPDSWIDEAEEISGHFNLDKVKEILCRIYKCKLLNGE